MKIRERVTISILTNDREKNKISKDEESFDSDLNKSFQEGTPEVKILRVGCFPYLIADKSLFWGFHLQPPHLSYELSKQQKERGTDLQHPLKMHLAG